MTAYAGMTNTVAIATQNPVIPAKAGIPFVLFFLLCPLLFPLAAFAADPALDPSFCRALIKHTPSADVAYQPGLDIHGKSVASADLPGAAKIDLPEEITIPLSADLFKVLNLSQTSLPFSAMQRNDIGLGTLTLRGDKVLYNGQPLSDAQQDNLAVLCLKPTKP